MEKIFNLVQLYNPSMVAILLLYRVKSVRLTNLSIPYITFILLNDKSSHFKFVRWSMFSIFYIMLLSSCNFYSLVRASRYWIFRMSILLVVYWGRRGRGPLSCRNWSGAIWGWFCSRSGSRVQLSCIGRSILEDVLVDDGGVDDLLLLLGFGSLCHFCNYLLI